MIIAVCNQKGGVGKTATAQALATCKGRTLAIDLDPQGNFSFAMGGNAADKGVYELLTGAAKPGEVIQTTRQGDVITACNELASIDFELDDDNRITALKDAIRPIRRRYRHIVIDCPPALNILLLNALAAADTVLIPLTADMYSLQGLYQLKQTIDDVKQFNSELTIGGAVFVKHNTRTRLAREITEVIKAKCKEYGIPVYKTTVREGVAIREAQTYRQSIFEYAPRSNPAQDYLKLIEEIGF